uniref:Uncharacterized protein n=1 Tax=Oncorhynchus kisutch TaxID=8019 RepID=A0A8C7JFF1_ONCKI
MKRQLELAVLGLGITGWLCAILTRCLPLWKVSGTLDDSTATLSRGLIMACIGAVVISIIGEVWFPKRNHVKVASGVVFVPVAWTCHHTNKPLEGAVVLRRDWGAALYIGWISSSLMVVGGGQYVFSKHLLNKSHGLTLCAIIVFNITFE